MIYSSTSDGTATLAKGTEGRWKKERRRADRSHGGVLKAGCSMQKILRCVNTFQILKTLSS